MDRVRILVPVPPSKQDRAGPGPDAGDLAGKLVGIRNDLAWRSFDWAEDEWTRSLTEGGSQVRHWTTNQTRSGEEGERATRELGEFCDAIDVGIFGLAN